MVWKQPRAPGPKTRPDFGEWHDIWCPNRQVGPNNNLCRADGTYRWYFSHNEGYGIGAHAEESCLMAYERLDGEPIR